MGLRTRAGLFGCAALLTGCGLFEADDGYLYEKPLVAVIAFENRVDFPLNWRLGEGIAEILEDSIYQTDSFRVLDRGDIDQVLKEQDFQSSGNTRPEQTVARNRLKNAHYLVKGVITEFAHVGLAGLDFGFGNWRIGGGGTYALVNIALKVTDVESGEVAYSEVIDGKVYAGGAAFDTVYKQVTLGGQAFYQTPLGHALQDALALALEGMTGHLARRRWQPTIAEIEGERIFLSGGHDRRVEEGSRWAVRTPSTPVIDPRTGDVLGQRAGVVVGIVRVIEVHDQYSVAVVDGDGTPDVTRLERGQRLEARHP